MPVMAKSYEFYGHELFQPFTEKDVILQSIFTGLLYIDWRQTKQGLEKENRYELNPLLGKHPSGEKVDTIISLALISHTFIAYALPPKYRLFWQHLFIYIESCAVIYNYHIGVRFLF